MPQPTIRRNFLTVNQAADRLHAAARTVIHWIATGQLKAEPLDPQRPTSDKIIAIAEVERFEKERKQ